MPLGRSLESVTLARLISPSLRSGLLTVVGTGLIMAPVALDLGVAAGVTGVIVGALAVALALAGTETSGRGTIPVSAYAVYDRGLALGLILSGLLFGAIGAIGAMALFGFTGVAALLVSSITRYTAPYSYGLPPTQHIPHHPPPPPGPAPGGPVSLSGDVRREPGVTR
jgi:hypothetical protein